MSKLLNKKTLQGFLAEGQTLDAEYILPPIDAALAGKLIDRIDNASFFMHAYAFYFNLRFGGYDAFDLLDFAKEQGLAGIFIGIKYGDERSLRAMDDDTLCRFGNYARDMGLLVHIETSSTTYDDLAQATRIAHKVGAKSIRCYVRYEGKVSEIILQAVEDLKQLSKLDPEGSLSYFIEPHCDLKSAELVEIIKAVGYPKLFFLFDFGNMVNALELPDSALTIMEPYVREVHVKDIKILEDNGGQAQLGCRSGTGDINMRLLMFRLLLLGKDEPQIGAFGLQEEVGYYAPAFRFPGEDSDPFIHIREASETTLDNGETMEGRIARERVDAVEQIIFIKKMLDKMRSLALLHI